MIGPGFAAAIASREAAFVLAVITAVFCIGVAVGAFLLGGL
jgi:hypothetical protein